MFRSDFWSGPEYSGRSGRNRTEFKTLELTRQAQPILPTLLIISVFIENRCKKATWYPKRGFGGVSRLIFIGVDNNTIPYWLHARL